ncbi:MAG TPA: flagellar basal body P-ring protein FlgI [Candidatus Angelobacter sp.]|nr:flagellar basal body P-ring protein FlgI [Candidatus Angelobacter sp.]
MHTLSIRQRVTRMGAGGSLLLLLLVAVATTSAEVIRHVQVRDITTVAGVRDNQLVGYGIVVGLSGTGDRSQTQFTTQTLANALRRMGVLIAPTTVRVTNVAAVFVTASLSEFARPGMTLDVTVSSIGDAKSLEGGVLLITSLQGPDGQVYASAQGPVTLGGYAVGRGGNVKMLNYPNVGRIPNGAIVERDTAIDLNRMTTVSLMLRDPDFTEACEVAAAINEDFSRDVARPIDSRRIDINVSAAPAESVTALVSRVQNLSVAYRPRAKVVINERTGTIVMGGEVKLSPVSVIHGSLSIEITTSYSVSQPAPFSNGKTTTTPDVNVQANSEPARSIRLSNGANVEELINGLHALDANSHEIVAILEAIKAAGGLAADLEVL